MTARGERVGRGERSGLAPSDPCPPAHPAPSLIGELAEQVHVAVAMQRRILGYGDSIESWWAELGWDTVDRALDRLDAALPPRSPW